MFMCMRVCVCGCVSAYFVPTYGCDLVISHCMLAHSYTSCFLQLCGFLVCLDKWTLAGARTCLRLLLLLCSILSNRPLSLILDTHTHVLSSAYLMAGWSCHM